MEAKITTSLVLYCVLATVCAAAISWVLVVDFGFIHSNWIGSQPLDQHASFLLIWIELVCAAAILPPVFKALLSETPAG